MQEELISIIIPVYNAEKFIKRCLDSIINQTYKNIEVICINDGSTDNSLKILKEYEKKYFFIRVYNQKNCGSGKTRNRGIDLSKGNYITFVDADDYIEKDYISKFISKYYNMDIVICGYKKYDENMNFLIKKIPSDSDIDYFKFSSTCCKLYNKKFLQKNNIRFSDRKIGEDVFFTLKCYSLTCRVNKVKYAGYCIVENLNSLTHSINSKNKANLFELVKEIDNKIDLKKFGDLYLFFYIKTIIMNLLMQSKCSFKEFYNLYMISFDWLEKTYKQNGKKLKSIWIKKEDFKINLLVNLFILFRKIYLIKPFLWLLQKKNFNL